MAESRARTGFGQVDLQVSEEPGLEKETDEAFGELDWDFPESEPPLPAQPASGTNPVNAVNVSARQTVRREDAEMDAVIDSTRIVSHAAMTPILEEERDKTPAPSASGVEATGDRVAAMREAYARGDADGALAIASAIERATMPPPAGGFDHPDAGVDIEVAGETEIEIDEEEPVDAKDLTRVAPSPSATPALSSLTERQGIPRVLLGTNEIAKLPLDHRIGFLLGYMDGMQTMEEILDVCPLPPNEVLELIRTLVNMGVIEIE